MDYKASYLDWLKNVNAEQKKELDAIADNDKEIKERFTIPLAFGTAGMRDTHTNDTSHTSCTKC